MQYPFQPSDKLYDIERVPIESRRLYHSFFYVYGGGVCIHIIYLIGAILIGNLPLKIFNICSILCWLVAIITHGYGFISLALVIAIIEIVTHAIFASWIIGWDAGFWIMALPIGIWAQIGRLSRKSVAFLSLTGLIVPIIIIFTMSANTKILSESSLDWVENSNIALILLMMGLAISVFESIASKLELELDLANAESERLIENMLPKTIAHRLKREERVIAEAYKNVSVIFCDIVGFTKLAETISPEEIIKILNLIFLHFDDLSEKLGLEKIKTIGDAYMAAAGVPETRPDHAEAAAKMALGMLEIIQKTNQELNLNLSVRVGIHTGHVVAGVIGKRKYAYDLWGGTVNIASRLESQGVAGKIQISQETAKALQDNFIIEERGSIMLKGIGIRNTYFLKCMKSM